MWLERGSSCLKYTIGPASMASGGVHLSWANPLRQCPHRSQVLTSQTPAQMSQRIPQPFPIEILDWPSPGDGECPNFISITITNIRWPSTCFLHLTLIFELGLWAPTLPFTHLLSTEVSSAYQGSTQPRWCASFILDIRLWCHRKASFKSFYSFLHQLYYSRAVW